MKCVRYQRRRELWIPPTPAKDWGGSSPWYCLPSPGKHDLLHIFTPYLSESCQATTKTTLENFTLVVKQSDSSNCKSEAICQPGIGQQSSQVVLIQMQDKQLIKKFQGCTLCLFHSVSSFKEIHRGQMIYPGARQECHSRSRTMSPLACRFAATFKLNIFLNGNIQKLTKNVPDNIPVLVYLLVCSI